MIFFISIDLELLKNSYLYSSSRSTWLFPQYSVHLCEHDQILKSTCWKQWRNVMIIMRIRFWSACSGDLVYGYMSSYYLFHKVMRKLHSSWWSNYINHKSGPFLIYSACLCGYYVDYTFSRVHLLFHQTWFLIFMDLLPFILSYFSYSFNSQNKEWTSSYSFIPISLMCTTKTWRFLTNFKRQFPSPIFY